MTDDDREALLWRLSEGQKACLRLVNDHLTSKEIARALGISPFTVDQRVDAARKKLNAASRKDAARIFAALENPAIYNPLVYEPDRIAVTDPVINQRTAVDQNDSGASPNNVAEDFSSIVAGNWWRNFIPAVGGKRHDLSKKDVFSRALNIVFFSCLTVAMAALVLTGAMRLLG